MESRNYPRLQRRITATTLAFSLIPLFVIGFSIYHQFSSSFTAKIMEGLKSRTANRADAIDLFFDERVSQLNTLALTHQFDQVIDEAYLNRVFTLMQMRAKSYVDLGIIDAYGNHVAYVGPYHLKGLNYKGEQWFQETLLRGIYISDVFTGFRNLPHFVICVLRREGEKTWILRATIDTEIFDTMVKAARSGQRGDAFVVNKSNILQTAPRFGGELLGQSGGPLLPRFFGVRLEEMNISGEPALIGASWLRNKEWLLIVSEDPREDLSPLFWARNLMFALIAGGVLMIVMGTLFVTRAMVGQLVESDKEKAALDAGLMQSSKMAALGKLAAGIAHEVNNPLAVIKEKVGWIKDLLEDEDLSKSENYQEFDDAVTRIDFHVDRAKKITHRLLGFARRMEPQHENVDVGRVVEETIEFLRNEAHYRNIIIETHITPGLPQTSSDSSQLQQVFLNILNNAIDAIGKNGLIAVNVDKNAKSGELFIRIADDGPGIPAESLGRIFDPFYTTKEVGKGTGLGLSISYSIVEKLGGRMTVASEAGSGTTFTIYLPVLEQQEPT